MSFHPLPVRYLTRKHQSFCLPPELEDVGYVTLPLYVLVALWALRQNRPVTVRDVRNAFALSLRRASDVLEYLTEQGAGIVEASCTLRPVSHGDRRMRREWLVTAVYDERARVSKTSDGRIITPSRIPEVARGDEICEAGHWFLRWRSGKAVPDDFL